MVSFNLSLTSTFKDAEGTLREAAPASCVLTAGQAQSKCFLCIVSSGSFLLCKKREWERNLRTPCGLGSERRPRPTH